MITGENLFSNLLTVGILIGLTIIVYCKMTRRTLVDVIRDMREAFSDKSEDIIDMTTGTFEGIR